MRVESFLFFALVSLLAPALASAQGKTPQPLAVVPLDDNSATTPLVSKTIDILRANSLKTLNASQIQLEVDKNKVRLDRVDASRLNDSIPVFAQANRIYFYDGIGEAIRLLGPAVEAGRSDLAALAARKAEADQFYRGNVIYARALREKGIESKDEALVKKAKAEVELLVELFPTMQPDPKNLDPEFIQLFANARAELDKKKTTITFLPYTSTEVEGCKLYINGFVVTGNGPFNVDPEREYILQMDCSRGSSPIGWRYTPTAGADNEVPIIDVEPLKMKMRDGSFDHRTAVEQRILFLFFWTGIETFVGISKNGATGTDDAMLLARATRADGQVRWSDQNRAPYCDGLQGFFPGLDFPDGACKVDEPERSRSRAIPLFATVVGLGVAGTGSYLWFTNERHIDRLRCSGFYGNATSCDGVDGYTEEELDALAEDDAGKNALPQKAVRNRNIGIGVTAAGGLLTVGGLVWTLTTPPKKKRARVDFLPSRQGGMVTIRADF